MVIYYLRELENMMSTYKVGENYDEIMNLIEKYIDGFKKEYPNDKISLGSLYSISGELYKAFIFRRQRQIRKYVEELKDFMRDYPVL